MNYQYSFVVSNIVDGDTVVGDVDLGFNTWICGMHIRLFGINAPELKTANGVEARRVLMTMVPLSTPIVLQSIKDRADKYGGRWLGILIVNGTNVNQALIEIGMAKNWNGQGPKP